MKFDILTIFPEVIKGYLNESIIGRAQTDGLVEINIHDIRDAADDKHNTVDDTPYGGGAGMVMKVDVIAKALENVLGSDLLDKKKRQENGVQVLLTDARGKVLNQKYAEEISKLNHVVIICGRYEGIDERILHFVDGQISIGDYVLTGGELAAMTVVDSVTRLVPGVLGNEDSNVFETHSKEGYLEHPQFTRPEVYTAPDGIELKVPTILLSGHHGEVAKWRVNESKRLADKK